MTNRFIAASLAALAATPAFAEPVTLKAGVFLPPSAAFAAPFARWAEHVNGVCAEHVKIDISGPEAIGSFEQPNALKIGVLDMLATPGTYYKGDMIEVDTTGSGRHSAAEQRGERRVGDVEPPAQREDERAVFDRLRRRRSVFSSGARTSPRMAGSKASACGRRPFTRRSFKASVPRPYSCRRPTSTPRLERGTVDGFGWPSWGISDFGWDKQTNYQHGPGLHERGDLDHRQSGPLEHACPDRRRPA